MRAPRFVLAILVIATLTAAGKAGHAHAYVLQPPGLDKHSITYFNGADQHAWAVSLAVEAWNETGADVTLQPGPREEAELVFSYMQGATALGGRTIQLDRSHLPDQLGKAQPGDAVVELPLLTAEDAHERRFQMALVAAHELGHVLGLGHQDSTCAAMNSTIVNGSPSACTPPPPGMWRCRLVEEDDARGAIALYGGELAPMRASPFCPTTPPPSPPVGLSVRLAASGEPKVVVQGTLDEPAAGTRVVLAQDRGACPASPAEASASTTLAPDDGRFRLVFSHRLKASTCYAAWSKDGFDRLSPDSATARFHPPPPPPAPGDVVLSVPPGVSPGGFGAALRWRNPNEDVASVLLAWDPVDCRDRPDEGTPVRRLEPTAGVQRFLDLRLFAGPPRTGCYTLWSRDAYGRLSEAARVPVSESSQDPMPLWSLSSTALPFARRSG